MPRISGVDIPADKRLVIALTYIYGIGDRTAVHICKELNLKASLRARELTEEDAARLNVYIEKNFPVEGQLRRQVQQAINRLKEVGSYRGSRHRRSLPVRGQRTRSNARTRKGPRKTVAGKKQVAIKK
ncbi:MAG: 30S ribosomal protein S13 [Planctomycetes bacterium]|nr:30S ribosomal protein S13 [Planctomycetota bacterium]